MAVTFEEEKQRARYNSLSLRFYVYFIQTHKRFKRTLFIRTKQNMLKSPVYIIVEIVIQRGVLTLAGEIQRCGNARLLLQKLLHWLTGWLLAYLMCHALTVFRFQSVCGCACACLCVRACVSACVPECVCVCVFHYALYDYVYFLYTYNWFVCGY